MAIDCVWFCTNFYYRTTPICASAVYRFYGNANQSQLDVVAHTLVLVAHDGIDDDLSVMVTD